MLGPLVVNIASPEAVILVVAFLYLLAAAFCFTLPPSPPPALADDRGAHPVGETRKAVDSTVSQLREGLSFIRSNHSIGWSLLYLGITASLVGVLGVLGPAFAQEALGLEAKDFAVVVLPLGIGIVMGILLLNAYGKYLPRRRVIEGGLDRPRDHARAAEHRRSDLAAAAASRRRDAPRPVAVTSLLAIVVVIAFVAGIAYGCVAIPSQTQLQEDLPEDVRGRVFGVLNMLVSAASFLPIIIVGPISDVIGTTAVILIVAILGAPRRRRERLPARSVHRPGRGLGRSARGGPDRGRPGRGPADVAERGRCPGQPAGASAGGRPRSRARAPSAIGPADPADRD